MPCHLRGLIGFVVILLMEADREGFHRARALRLHQRDDSRRINASGKKCAQRNVSYHSQSYRLQQECIEILTRLCWSAAIGIVDTRLCSLPRRPIRRDKKLSGLRFPKSSERPGHELIDIVVNGLGRRNVIVPEKKRDTLAIDLRLKPRVIA